MLDKLRDRRMQALVLSLVVIAVVLLLAVSLSGLELMPGDPDAFNWVFQFMEYKGSFGAMDPGIMNIFRVIYLIGLVLMPFYLIYVIINPKARKQFIRDMIIFTSFILVFLLFANYLKNNMKEVETIEAPEFGIQGEIPSGEGDALTLPESPPNEALWIAALAVALVVVVILTLVIWLFWRSRRRPDSTVERIAQEVQQALDDLSSGADLRNVVIRCYSEMVKALNEKRGIQRSTSLTPREFEYNLQTLGFPLQPVHQLTGLFEGVRYGHKPISKREEIIAVDCLTSILDACRSNP